MLISFYAIVLGELYTQIFFFLKNLAFDFQHFSKKRRVFRDAILLIDSVGRGLMNGPTRRTNQTGNPYIERVTWSYSTLFQISYLVFSHLSSSRPTNTVPSVFFPTREGNETSAERWYIELVHIVKLFVAFETSAASGSNSAY